MCRLINPSYLFESSSTFAFYVKAENVDAEIRNMIRNVLFFLPAEESLMFLVCLRSTQSFHMALKLSH